jgi:hypothetical protein
MLSTGVRIHQQIPSCGVQHLGGELDNSAQSDGPSCDIARSGFLFVHGSIVFVVAYHVIFHEQESIHFKCNDEGKNGCRSKRVMKAI